MQTYIKALMFQRNNNNVGVCAYTPQDILTPLFQTTLAGIAPTLSESFHQLWDSLWKQLSTRILVALHLTPATKRKGRPSEDIRDENTDGSNPSLLNISDMTQRMKATNASKFVKRWWWGRIGKGNQRNSFQLAFKGNAPSAALYVCVHWALFTNMQWSTWKVGRTDEKKTQPSLHPLDLSN